MKKKIVSVLLALLLVCVMTSVLTACAQPHKCDSVCPECNLCLSDCEEEACANKCKGHDAPDPDPDPDPDPAPDPEGFAVTFVCDENVKVYVYDTQDMSSEGTEATKAYSRDGETGALLNDGNGQVNFRLVFTNGYKLANIVVSEGYNNLKGSADTGVQNGYRITKITDNLTVTITSQLEEAGEDLTQGFKVTFECDEHVSVIVYKTQDMTSGGEKTNTAYSREGGTGTLTKEGGQVNFVLVFEEGYELSNITATAGTYKNIKYPSEIGVENGYRITQITDELTVTVTSKEVGAEEDLSNGYQIVFQGEHVKIIVYKTQDLTADGEETTVAYSRDGDNGSLLKDGKGQVNFIVIVDEGYELVDVTVTSGTFGNVKGESDTKVENGYRITKIQSDLVVTVTVTATN